ncbi:MAG: DUF4886 domain-containing protein [Saprospiraceae bacterium]|nr:DUF4886 domain-containing protein [Saprospiraceae bacterium]
MKSILTILLSLLLINLVAQNSKDILFIGNSLTYYHQMPQTLQRMFDANQDGFKVLQSTYPALSLQDHCEKMPSPDGKNWRKAAKGEVSPTIQLLKSQSWHTVILQEASMQILIPEAKAAFYDPYIRHLNNIIKTQESKTILYETYALGEYPQEYCYPCIMIDAKIDKMQCCSNSFTNSKQEYRVIKRVYEAAAKKLDAEIAPVGYAFELCRQQYPDIPLQMDNGDPHPSTFGAYLIACVFYQSITQKPATEIIYLGGIEKQIAEQLQEIAVAATKS